MHLKKDSFSYLNIGVLTVIILFGFLLYLYPLRNAFFCYDDHTAIENNDVIKHIDIPRIFDAFNTRFLVGLSFALNYKWSALHPAGYRIINLLIHCLNAFLVYLLIKSTLGLLRTEKSEWPAVFASMLFLCHPIQTEPVNSITQRFVLMGTFFYLLTLVLYVEYRCRSQKRYLIASFGSAIAAMFCKEFVVTLPLMLALYEFYFLKALAGSWWRRCSRLLPFFVIALIVPLLLLRTPPEAIGVANIADSDFSHIDITRAHGSIGREHYFLTELNVVCTYVRLLFLPFHQNFDYDYPISNHVDTKTALCGIFLLGLLALAAVTYKSNRLISFSILWFFIALSVESSFIPIAHVIAEYRVYLASVGFAFLVTALIYMRQVDVKRLNIIAAIILMGFSIVTLQRNKVWKSELALWNDTVPKSPHKARPYNSRGFAYYNQGKLIQAISDYTKGIDIDPSDTKAYYDRGLAYYLHGDLIQAISDFTKAIELDPNNALAYYNRGLALYNKGNLAQAMSDYNKAIEIDPNYAVAYDNRGVAYYKQDKFTQALLDYNRAIKIDPNLAEAYMNRGIFYDHQGNLTHAIADYTKAMEINPNFAEAYNNRGTAYDRQGNFIQVISDLTKAIEINPKYAQAYDNRGIAYFEQGQFVLALSDYNKAIEIDPKLAEAYLNRGIFYDHQGNLLEAIADYTKAIEINPHYAEAYDNQGVAYYKQGQLTQALSDYDKAIEIDPKLAEAYMNRGIFYGSRGDLSRAIADYTQAIEIDPNNAEVYNNRGMVYGNQGDWTQAMSDFDKAIAIKPENGDAYGSRAEGYYTLKEYDKAWADVRKEKELGAVVDPEFVNKLKQALGNNATP